eukprot:Skav211417  [mRNA]  locus=scaffold1608:146634:149236:+ [translate_table: standard]
MGFSHLSLAVTFSKCELFREVIVKDIERSWRCGRDVVKVSCDMGTLRAAYGAAYGDTGYTLFIWGGQSPVLTGFRQANKKQVAHEDFEDDKLEARTRKTCGKAIATWW